GYATAAVAALSDELLRSGCRTCCLTTDLADPTSNAIYTRIGYRPLQDLVEIAFFPEPMSP
nr:GNAT family N-acetyltransferase [Myxococcota bacterium]